MAFRDHGSGSPWASSTFLPFTASSRRNSVTSLSSRTARDRETLSQALDDIHNSASQNTNLVTFNDFGPPPPPPKDEERPASQGGLGGLYARLRPSSSGNKGATSTASSARKHHKSLSDAKGPSIPSTPSTPSLTNQREAQPNASTSPQRPAAADLKSPILHSPLHEPTIKPLEPVVKDISLSDNRYEGNAPPSTADGGSVSAQVETVSPVPDVDAMQKHRAPTDTLAVESSQPSDMSISAASAKLAVDSARDTGPLSPGDNKQTGILVHQSTPDGARSRSPIKADASKIVPPRLTEDTLKHRGAAFAALSKINVPGSSASDITESNADGDVSPTRSNATLATKPISKKPSTEQSSSLIHEMRRKVLNRDFWMRDENAKACFNCGDNFTAFRRKHHCRTCGQIYDAKCTILMPGNMFGQEGRLRICKTCENIIVGDDSSDYSDDDSHSVSASHGRSIRFTGLPPTPEHASTRGVLSDGKQSELARPLLDPRRRIPPYIIDTNTPTLTRPSSSRSLKSLAGRPRSSSHRHRRSKHQHLKSLSLLPQHGAGLEDSVSKAQSDTTARSEDVIDPDLAPFMSDEGSSDEDQHTIASALHGSTSGSYSNSTGFTKRTRPRPVSSRSIFELAQHHRDSDNVSIRSSRPSTRRRQTTRTLSMGSAMGGPPVSPRVVRSENLFTDGYGFFDSVGSALTQEPMKYEDDNTGSPGKSAAPPLAELNKPSLEHFKTLLTQLLKDTGISDARRWQKVLVPILLRCAEEIDPNIQRGDDIDIRNYVKLKKAPAGRIRDTLYLSGVVFTKNVALKGMRRSIKSPRLLLLSFPVVYARHQHHFMSLDAVLAQEKEYLRNLVRRIVALEPDVVLAQRQIAGYALDLLKEANITVVQNVKESALQAVSRCSQTRIISSVDKLAMDAKHLGFCDDFDVKAMVFEASKKSCVFISGCQKDLGCTIILRGADKKTLHKVKWITEFMCYVAYNLKLETSLIRDQFSLTPTFHLVDEDSINKEIQGETNALDHSLVDVSGRIELTTKDSLCQFSRIYIEMKRRILSISPSVTLSEPHLLLKGLAQEKQLLAMKARYQLLEQSISSSEDTKNEDFELIKPEMLSNATRISKSSQHALRAVHDAEYSKANQYYATLRRRWDTFIASSKEPFSPLSHQQIIVLFSNVSKPSMNPCEGPALLGLGFYQEHSTEHELEPDMPLGEYVERLCEQANTVCLAGRCDKAMIDHCRQYAHGDGQVTVSTERLKSKMRGLENTILMWSVCRECQQETPVVPMSRNTWKYSFAKYLELSFWSRPLHPRAGICPHDIHKCHKRYFGFNNLALSISYDSIKIMEVSMPRSVVFWKVDKDIAIKNEEYARIEDRLKRFMNSVTARIESINLDGVKEEDLEKCSSELASFQSRVLDEQESLKRKLRDKYTSSQYYETIPLNRAVRAIQEKVAAWDGTFAEFERKYFPSEKDLRRLATQQLKNAYLGRNDLLDSEKLNEKNELVTSETLSHTVSPFDTEDPDSRSQDKSDPTRHYSSTNENANEVSISSTAKTSAIPIGGHVGRMIDELDLAKSPESPIARQKAAALNIEDERAGSDVISEDHRLDDDKDVVQAHEMDRAHKRTGSMRRRGQSRSPILLRSHTQPPPSSRDVSPSEVRTEPTNRFQTKSGGSSLIPVAVGSAHPPGSNNTNSKSASKPASNVPFANKGSIQSMIPRSNFHRSTNSVSTITKHFEQMSREYEKLKARERRQRAARVHYAQVYSTASVQPVVEVFKDADAAVNEPEPSPDHSAINSNPSSHFTNVRPRVSTDQDMSEADTSFEEYQQGKFTHTSGTNDEMRSDQSTINVSSVFSDNETVASDVEPSALTDSEEIFPRVEAGLDSPDEGQLEFLELPKHDKTSIMKMLRSFWSERSASGWAPLDYPLVPTDHIFADSDIIVREDEPSSLIAFSLGSKDYQTKIGRFRDRVKTEQIPPAAQTVGETDIERTLLGSTATHLKYQFQAGPSRMLCKVFYAESFDAIRQRCGVSDRFVESLSRCLKWDSRGGKTKSIFLKTMDERFVLKQLSTIEAQAFLRFAPDYFDYMSKCLFHSLPSTLAKMLGVYQVIIKNPVTGIDFNCFLQVMENVFYEGPSHRMFDLKGSMRNRKIQSTGEQNEVLLDENLLDYISQAPMYLRNHANSFLTSSITNDTLFCAKQNVMDYSLIVGLYEDRSELMVGIIDYIRTYTWDKKLEAWFKDRGKNKPTVRSPREYRNRFRASISRYFPLAPSCWQVFGGQRAEPSGAWWDSLGISRDGNPNRALGESVADSE